MKNALLVVLVVLALLLGGVSQAAAGPMGFSDYYAPGNFSSSTTNGGDGSIDTSGVPTSITLTSSDNGVGFSEVLFTIAAPNSGPVTFDYSYTTADADSMYDPFGYVINGLFTQVTADGSADPQSGTVSFAVNTGDVFGFDQQSSDSSFGPGMTTITNFDAPSPVPEPATLTLLGFGIAGLTGYGWRRRKQPVPA